MMQSDKNNNPEVQSNALSYVLYGLTDEEIAVVEGREVDSSAQSIVKATEKKTPPAVEPVKVVEEKTTLAKKQVAPSDYGLNKCSECGSMVMGFTKEEHVKELHKGQDVNWTKMGESRK